MIGFEERADSFLRFVLQPRFVLVSLAALHFLAVPGRYHGLCLYNWAGALWSAFVLLIAAFTLWAGRWWGYFIAAALSVSPVYDFSFDALKVHGLLRASPGEESLLPSAAVWREIFIYHHPEELIPVILAAVIFGYSVFCLIRCALRMRHPLP